MQKSHCFGSVTAECCLQRTLILAHQSTDEDDELEVHYYFVSWYDVESLLIDAKAELLLLVIPSVEFCKYSVTCVIRGGQKVNSFVLHKMADVEELQFQIRGV